jgi:two-component system, NarL family, nitrate/nitrite response regulator NarL
VLAKPQSISDDRLSLAPERFTLVVVHPSRLFCEGLGSVLKETPYKLSFLTACVDGIPFDKAPEGGNVIFMVGGASPASIAEMVRQLRSRRSLARIVVLGASDDPNDVMLSLEAGADGYLREAITTQTLIKAIELVARDEAILPPLFVKSLREGARSHDRNARTQSDADHAAYGPSAEPGAQPLDRLISKVDLSAREESILKGLVDGAPNKVIAQKLNITEATVKVHVKAILRKTRVRNRTQAAIWGVKYFEPKPPNDNPYPVISLNSATVRQSMSIATEISA